MKNKPLFVLLAGGKSERMGVDKGLLKFNDTFWILEQLKRISASDIDTVFIGLGYNYSNYFKAIPIFEKAINENKHIENLNIRVIINPNPQYGAFSTLQKVLQALNNEQDVLIHPIDVPILNSIELKKLCAVKTKVVIPNFNGKNGHPVKIEYNLWRLFLNLDLKANTSRLDFLIKNLPQNNITTVAISDKNAVLNLNNRSNWKTFLKHETNS
jgi:CTP:molybdopterin cytidylyltransferase MocA